MAAHEITMNKKTNNTNEADITFGNIYMAFCIWIYNMRISFPYIKIVLEFIDISACFRFLGFFADLIEAFRFMIGSWFFA